MKVLVALLAVVACVAARPGGFGYAVTAPAYPYAAYSYGAYPYSAYPYASALSYASALPYAAPWAYSPYKSYALPVVTPSGYLADTPEVAHAKAAHFAEVAAAKLRSKRSAVIPVQTPASTTPLVHAPVVAPAVLPYSYAAPIPAPAPLAYAAPLPYAAPAPLPYAAPAPLPYAAPAVLPAVPALRPATLTTVVNTPGHAISYRVD